MHFLGEKGLLIGTQDDEVSDKFLFICVINGITSPAPLLVELHCIPLLNYSRMNNFGEGKWTKREYYFSQITASTFSGIANVGRTAN